MRTDEFTVAAGPPDRWHRVEALFHEALEQPADARGPWLDHVCTDDPDLRQELERLLAADGGAAGQLAAVIQGAVSAWQDAELSGRHIGSYHVSREIGRGGMGVVYLGVRDDDVFHKQVAIKIVKRGMDTDSVLQRFRHERRILASLDHPFITRVIDGGSTDDGRPYLVMEYVSGLPITTHCQQRGLDLEERLLLFRKVCDAVQHAHRNLVLHRDLKPSNILVNETGEPRLLDFGIAKLLAQEQDFTALTSGTGIPLTPRYASPEQLRGEPVTTAADVYALGAVLYEMLTGQPAQTDARRTPADTGRFPAEGSIVAPSAMAQTADASVSATSLAGDLDTIVLKALRFDPRDRYGSVEQFSEDVERYLEHLPVRARPVTLRYRMAKSLRRNRGTVAAAALIIMTLLGGITVSTLQARRAERRFEDVRRLANAVLFDIDDRLLQVPGTTDVREAIVRTSLTYLDALAGESASDPTLLFELASGYQKIGDVQGYPYAQNLGQRTAAIESHRKALAIARRLYQGRAESRVQRLLVRGHDRLGVMLWAERDEAAEHFREGLSLAGQLDAAEPENAAVLIDFHGHLGEFEAAGGDSASAMADWRRTLEIGEASAARQPGDMSRSALGLAHWRLSRALQQSGDTDGAARHARESVTINEAVAEGNPRDMQHRRRLLNSYEQAGYAAYDATYPSEGDPVAAVAHHSKALAIAEELSAEDPHDVRAASDLSISQRNVCGALSQYDLAAAEQMCRAGLATVSGFAGVSQEQRSSLLADLAAVLSRRGNRAAAQELIREALQLQERSASSAPTRSDRRLALLRMHNQLGAMLVETGDVEGALQQHRRALTLGESLLESHTTDPILRRILADTYEHLASISVARGENRRVGRAERAEHWREAKSWLEKSLDVWNEWPQWAVASSFDAQRKARALQEVARCDAAIASLMPS